MGVEQKEIQAMSAMLPPEQYKRYYLNATLPGDQVLIMNTHPYAISEHKSVFVATLLDSHLYRIVSQEVFLSDEYTAVTILLDAYPQRVSYPDDLAPIHRMLARCKPKLAELHIRLIRTTGFAYGLKAMEE